MTLNEQLNELKLSEEKLEAIQSALTSEYVVKADFDALSNSLSALQTDYSALSDALNAARSEHKKLKQSAEESLNRQREDFERQIKEQLIELALTEAGSKNNEVTRSLIDTEKVTVNDGKLSGLEVQLNKLRKKAAFLFEDGLVYLTGYRPEPSSDLLPKVSGSGMTYSETVAYLERNLD